MATRDLTPDEEHALIRAEARRLTSPRMLRTIESREAVLRRRQTRHARLQAAADAGYDTWDDYRGER